MSSTPTKALRARGGDKARLEKSSAPMDSLKRGAAEVDPDTVVELVDSSKRAKLSTTADSNKSSPSDPTIGTPSAWSPTPPVTDPSPDPAAYIGVDHIDSAALDRALKFFDMTDTVNGRYNISNLPSAAKWGNKYDTEKYLCDKSNRKLTVWLVGVVKTAWFTTSAGDPVPRVNVSVRPVRALDLSALHQLVRRGKPVPERVPDRASASRFQTRRVKGQAAPQAYMFDRIFDATVKFKAKSQMNKLPPSRVGRGDFVLIEAFVNRYKTAGDHKGWTDWNVTLELNELSVVYEAPEGFVDDEDETPSIEVDDDI